MKKESMIFPFRWIKSLEMLSDAEFRSMVTAIIEYAESGSEPSFVGAMACAWKEYKQRIDNDRERYAQICEKRRNAGMKGAEYGHLGGRPRKTANGVLETAKNPKKPQQNPKETAKTPDPDPDPDPDAEAYLIPPYIPPLEKGGETEGGIAASDDNPKKDTKKTPPDNAKDQIQEILKARINALFKRKNTTVWSEKERKALREISKREGVLDEMAAIESLYNSGYEYRRRDVSTFLNNFATEFDRSQNCQQNNNERKMKNANDRNNFINNPEQYGPMEDEPEF